MFIKEACISTENGTLREKDLLHGRIEFVYNREKDVTWKTHPVSSPMENYKGNVLTPPSLWPTGICPTDHPSGKSLKKAHFFASLGKTITPVENRIILSHPSDKIKNLEEPPQWKYDEFNSQVTYDNCQIFIYKSYQQSSQGTFY